MTVAAYFLNSKIIYSIPKNAHLAKGGCSKCIKVAVATCPLPDGATNRAKVKKVGAPSAAL